MFGLSFGELVIVAILALVLLGPEKLPDAAKQAGKLMRELRRATDDLKDQIEGEMYADDRRAKPSFPAPVPAAPSAPAGPPPAASAENVPGLDAALAEPAAPADVAATAAAPAETAATAPAAEPPAASAAPVATAGEKA